MFCRNLILSITCEFYYDDVNVTLFINIKYINSAVKNHPIMNSALLFVFCGQKDLVQMPFTPTIQSRLGPR